MNNQRDSVKEFITKFFDEEVMNLVWLVYVYRPPIELELLMTSEPVTGMRELNARMVNYILIHWESIDKDNRGKNEILQLGGKLSELFFEEMLSRAEQLKDDVS